MTHRNLTSSSLNDISDKPDKEQVRLEFQAVIDLERDDCVLLERKRRVGGQGR